MSSRRIAILVFLGALCASCTKSPAEVLAGQGVTGVTTTPPGDGPPCPIDHPLPQFTFRGSKGANDVVGTWCCGEPESTVRAVPIVGCKGVSVAVVPDTQPGECVPIMDEVWPKGRGAR